MQEWLQDSHLKVTHKDQDCCVERATEQRPYWGNGNNTGNPGVVELVVDLDAILSCPGRWWKVSRGPAREAQQQTPRCLHPSPAGLPPAPAHLCFHTRQESGISQDRCTGPRTTVAPSELRHSDRKQAVCKNATPGISSIRQGEVTPLLRSLLTKPTYWLRWQTMEAQWPRLSPAPGRCLAVVFACPSACHQASRHPHAPSSPLVMPSPSHAQVLEAS